MRCLSQAGVDYTNFLFALPSVCLDSGTTLPPLMRQTLGDAGLAPGDPEHDEVSKWLARFLVQYRGVDTDDSLEVRCACWGLLHSHHHVLPQERVAAMLRSNPRIIPRNFHMHAVIRQTEASLRGVSSAETTTFNCGVPCVQQYLAAITSPFFKGSSDAYMHYSTCALPRQTRARDVVWAFEEPVGAANDALTEPVTLYPHLFRPGVSVCSCSS